MLCSAKLANNRADDIALAVAGSSADGANQGARAGNGAGGCGCALDSVELIVGEVAECCFFELQFFDGSSFHDCVPVFRKPANFTSAVIDCCVCAKQSVKKYQVLLCKTGCV